jgi:hypothetical protein
MEIEEKITFVQSTIEPMAWHTYPHIAGIVAVEDAITGQHVGSAVRCLIDGRQVLVTAAHVVREAQCAGRWAVTAVRGQAPFELGKPDLLNETSDLAACFLPENFPKNGLAFWPDERIDATETHLSTDYLFVHGFPGERARFSPLLGGLVKQSLPYGVMRREDGLPNEMQSFQFAMDFDPANMFLRDGGAADWIDPHGLSGSPVWRIGASGQRVNAWTPEMSLLVGIVTAWRPDEKLLLATSTRSLLDLLRP